MVVELKLILQYKFMPGDKSAFFVTMTTICHLFLEHKTFDSLINQSAMPFYIFSWPNNIGELII